MSRSFRILALGWLLSMLPASVLAQDSPLFTGRSADVWLVDSGTGQVTGYDNGTWVPSITPLDISNIALGVGDALLINGLQNSSPNMSAGQPILSFAGIGDEALELSVGGRHGLTVLPQSGTFRATIAVTIGVSTALLQDGAHRLTWSAVETGSGTTVASDDVLLAQGLGGAGENGYFKRTFYLVNNGNYFVSARLQGAAVDKTETQSYDLVIPAGEQRRDTDGDGIPDAVEIDMGLNPLKDDWLADTDGNGWSQFDEWLRRYCLDPNTFQPDDGGAPCLDADGVPLDTDADNWTDFDEILRGTNHLDPEPVILEQTAAPSANDDDDTPPPAAPAAELGSEYVERQRLRYKDFPAANRLYEVEYRIDAGSSVLDIPPVATVLLGQQSAGLNQGAYKGIVVQSYTPAQNNIAGINFRVAADNAASGVEDVVFNIWAGSLRDGELLLSQKLDQVKTNGDPDQPLVLRFEPVAVQPGQPIYFEFRKGAVALVTTGADTLAGGGVIEIDGVASSGLTDLVFDVYYDANFTNGIGGTRASMQWWNLAAADLDGVNAYDATTLLRDNEIAEAGLTPTDIAPRRRMSTLQNAFATGRLPAMRLPAGNSVILGAALRNQSPPQEGWQVPADYSRIYKNWLPRSNDVTPQAMFAEIGEGAWTTPAEWRQQFIAFLVPRLVAPAAITLNESSTLEVAIVEAALSEEARIDGSGGVQVLTRLFQPGQPIYAHQPGQPIYGSLLTDESPFVNEWEDNLERLSSDSFNLDQSFDGVGASLGAGGSLEATGQWLRKRFHAGVPGTSSDHYMSQQFLIAFPDVCKVPTSEVAARQADVAGWNEFLDQCSAWVDDAGYAQYLADLEERCYLVRLNLLPGAASEISADVTLREREADSDSDGALNASEIENPVREVTLPWLFDTDGDSIADFVDPCPNDPYNDCSANPIRPMVTLDADFAVNEPITGTGFALVSVQLERIYDVPVTVCYEAIMDLGDTATADVDFVAVTGCVIIEPGQLSALIEIPVNADAELDAGETFSVRITSITNGSIGDDGLVVVTLNDPVAVSNTAPVFTSAGAISSASGSTDTGYTATAIDAEGDTLSFSISGGADQAQFGIDSTTGVLSFVVAPDFNAPADADGDNDYEVQLIVDDGNAGTDTLDLIVSVIEAGLMVEVTYPTPNANLGGSVTLTTVTGKVVDPLGNPVNLADINFVSVNGRVATFDAGNPGRWSVQVPVSAGENTLAVTLERSDASQTTFNLILQNFVVHSRFADLEFDATNNRLLVIDWFADELLTVDLATGDRAVLSGATAGTGPALVSPTNFAMDDTNNRALLYDAGLSALVAVNLTTGDRSILANDATGVGPSLSASNDLVLDSVNNRVLVANGATGDSKVLAVNLANGDRSVLSSAAVGTGPEALRLRDIALDSANNRAFVIDTTLDAVISVDLATGDRTIVANAATGTGINFSTPERLVYDAPGNRVLVADIVRGLIAVDLATGNRTVVNAPTNDYGANGSRLSGLVFNPTRDTAYLSDYYVDAVFAVDLASGVRSIVSDSVVGNVNGLNGLSVLFGIQGIGMDTAGNRVLTVDSYRKVIWGVDVASGDRSVVSGDTSGSGPAIDFPGKLDVDVGSNRAYVVEQNRNAVTRIDLANGDRVDLSGGTSGGTGPAFTGIKDITLDPANDRALVVDWTADAVFEVDLSSGNRTIVSNSSTGNGQVFSVPTTLAYHKELDRAYVLDWDLDMLIAVDLQTGDRSVISSNAGIGTGNNFSVPFDMVVDHARNRVLIVDYGTDLMSAIDLANGDRTVISSTGVGSGPGFEVPYYIADDLANNRVFVYDLILRSIVVVDLATGERAITSK